MSTRGALAVFLVGIATIAPAEQPWWESFENEALSALIETGLASHPDPAAALARVEAARQDRQRVGAATRPVGDLQLALRAGREKTMYTNREPGDIDPVAAGARISWELDLFGRVQHAKEAADARGEQSESDRQGVRLLLSTEIAERAFEAAALRKTLALHQEIQDGILRLDARTRARVRVGLEPQSGSDRARARYEMAQHARMLTSIRLDKTLNRLSSLVGTKVVLEALPDLTDFTLPPPPAFEAETRMQGRPDVLSAWWRLQGFLSEAESAKRARAPTFALVASAAGEASGNDTEPWEAWIGPTIQLPFWRPDLRAVTRRARAEAAAARSSFEAVSLTALREIEDARIDRLHAGKMIEHLAARRENLSRSEAADQRKRRAGLIQESEWQESRITHLEAVRDLVDWQKNGLIAHLEIIKALGGTPR